MAVKKQYLAAQGDIVKFYTLCEVVKNVILLMPGKMKSDRIFNLLVDFFLNVGRGLVTNLKILEAAFYIKFFFQLGSFPDFQACQDCSQKFLLVDQPKGFLLKILK